MSDDEGTPMEGPLPLELQQIRADTQREEAALEAAKAALAAQRRKSEVSYQRVAILLKRDVITDDDDKNKDVRADIMSSLRL